MDLGTLIPTRLLSHEPRKNWRLEAKPPINGSRECARRQRQMQRAADKQARSGIPAS